MGPIKEVVDPSIAFRVRVKPDLEFNGKEPRLGGVLNEKAVWVDESTCIGCRYCANVATNTFVIEQYMGRSRAIRQDGDNQQVIQEAIDTCPVNCIHWVKFEELDDLREQLDALDLQPLGMLPKVPRQIRQRKY